MSFGIEVGRGRPLGGVLMGRMAADGGERADPARSLAILWRTREPVNRGGRVELSVDRIARAAIEVADAEGIGALTMRRVSESLGAGTMSIYTYVPGKGELLDIMIDTVYGEMARPEYPPGGWRARLEAVARENWELYRRHPWMVRVETSRPVLGPRLMAKYDYELRALAGTGLSDLETDSVVTLVLGHVRSAAREAVDALDLERSTGMTDRQWWQASAPWLERFMTSEAFPTAARIGAAAGQAHDAAHDPEHAFEFGLVRVLDGVAVLIEGR